MQRLLGLTVIIPCKDDTANLLVLLSRLSDLNLAEKVIIVDDGSCVPIVKEVSDDMLSRMSFSLKIVRNNRSMGAGAARNQAIPMVKSDFLMFIDSDDLPTRELKILCAALSDIFSNGNIFDFCIFKHHDSRMARDGLYGQMTGDEDLWLQAGVHVGALCKVSDKGASLLAQTSNYPWNKIYSTDFYRSSGLQCSETPVHNDIKLHWLSFANSKNVWSSDIIGIHHFVHPSGARLTNRKDAERLCLFDILKEVYLDIEPLQLPFLLFSINLLVWAEANIEDNLKLEFQERVRNFSRLVMNHESRQLLMTKHPSTMKKLSALCSYY